MNNDGELATVLVLEHIGSYMGCKNMSYFLTQHGLMDEAAAKVIIRQLISGLAHCHSHEVVHRDIKVGCMLHHWKDDLAHLCFMAAHFLLE